MKFLRAGVVAAGLWAACGAEAQFDFSEVTTLAQGAVDGTNVDTPIPGFDLLLMRDGVVVYHQAFGLWSLNRTAAADSCSKTVSGALMLSAIENAATPITLDTRVSQFIPEFNGLKTGVTLRQCFSHTSGLQGVGIESDESLTLQQAALEIAAVPLGFLPGTRFDYGGNGMHSAGAVVELAAGMTWNTLYDQRLASPLGLTVTRYVLTTPENPRIAGGCESNAGEYSRFMEMLRRGGLHRRSDGSDIRLLQASSVAMMFTRQTAAGIPIDDSPLGSSDYGVGVWLDQRDGQGRLIGAVAGGARGFTSWIDFDDRMVGTIATDLTQNQNLQPAMYMIRDAAQRAVRAACRADFNQNGAVTVQDVFDFLAAYFAGDSAADVNGSGGVSVQDVFDFLTLYFTACP